MTDIITQPRYELAAKYGLSLLQVSELKCGVYDGKLEERVKVVMPDFAPFKKGNLSVIDRFTQGAQWKREYMYLCICDCGKKQSFPVYVVDEGHSLDCGRCAEKNVSFGKVTASRLIRSSEISRIKELLTEGFTPNQIATELNLPRTSVYETVAKIKNGKTLKYE